MRESWKEYHLDEPKKAGARSHLVRLKVFRMPEREGRAGLEEWCYYQVRCAGKAALVKAMKEMNPADWVFRIICGSKTGFYYDMECRAGEYQATLRFRSFPAAEQRALILAKKHLLQQEIVGRREEKQLAVANLIQKYR